MPVDEIALLKLGYDGFAKLVRYFGKRRSAAKLEKRINAAWRELVKGNAADDATIEAALAAAKAAGDTSPAHVRLEDVYRSSRAPVKKKAKAKTGGKKRKASTRKAAPRKRRKAR